MRDHELLLAISNMMDEKLKESLRPIEILVESLKNRMEALENSVESLKNRMDSLEGEVKVLNNKMGELDSNVGMLMEKMLKVEVKLENDISSRMQNIENCYLSTFNRYQASADTYEEMQADHQLLKQVVAKHSQRLQVLEQAVCAN